MENLALHQTELKIRLERPLQFNPMSYKTEIREQLDVFNDQLHVTMTKRLSQLEGLRSKIRKREQDFMNTQRLYIQDQVKYSALTIFINQLDAKIKRNNERKAQREKEKRAQIEQQMALTERNDRVLSLMATEDIDMKLLAAPNDNYDYEDGFLIEVNRLVISLLLCFLL